VKYGSAYPIVSIFGKFYENQKKILFAGLKLLLLYNLCG
jgi:hypothetical protein